MYAAGKEGKVILAGAGPGDPELITLKLKNRLADADVIITDRLVKPFNYYRSCP
ncbi:MAG: SAM-dependent methyltransferase [Bacteroidota bacterium]